MSYRREDTKAACHRIHQRLGQHFGRERLFIDVDDILPGTDFVKALEDNLATCSLMFVIIGRHWTQGQRLLDTNDFVRREVESALRSHIPILPILVDGASMPSESEIPNSLHELTRRHAIELDTGVTLIEICLVSFATQNAWRTDTI